MLNKLPSKEVLDFFKTLTILCVEDNEDISVAYESIFSTLFGKICFAKNGKEGFKKYKNGDIDIILTDHSMPQMTGLEMASKIRKTDKDTPIILVTAFNNSDLLVNALNININRFVQKPMQYNTLMQALEDIAKILIANRYIKERGEYHIYQEELGFAKELNILKNDFYYQLVNNKNSYTIIDFLYMPIDIMSGDAYSARLIDEDRLFFMIVDGMGKGISASLSAMIFTAYINHTIDKSIKNSNFNFTILIEKGIDFIKSILLEEEILSVDLIVIDKKKESLDYAKFSMPFLLMQDIDSNIIKLPSNNPPISKYLDFFHIDSYNISNIVKFLFYSDGLVENSTIHGKSYSDFIEKDFLNSFTKREMKENFLNRIKKQEDDVTIIFINKIDLQKKTKDIYSKTFATKLSMLENDAIEHYTDILKKLNCDVKTINKESIIFTELLTNAYEHGNLGIDKNLKHNFIKNGTFEQELLKKESICDKKIDITVRKVIYNNSTYIITIIKDEGDGFDTQILSKIFRNSHTYNGRGILISKKNSLGIYYNKKGNSVLYINKAATKTNQ